MAMLPSLSEEAKSYIDGYICSVIKLNEITPLEFIKRHLKYRHVVTNVLNIFLTKKL